MNTTIGTCSKCGGPVKVPNMSTNTIPYCERCGAKMINPYGPVVKMK